MLLACVTSVWAEDFSQTYSYAKNEPTGWSLTNYSDTSSYYLVPNEGDVSVATIPGIFTDKTITSDVVVTLNVATYGSGTNPSASTFSLYTSSNCSTQVTATQGGTLPTSKTFTDVTYTVSKENAANLTNDLAIKITKPGKQIRLNSIKVTFSYKASTTAPLTAITISIPKDVQLKKEYIVGTGFDVTGIKAIATYDGAPEEDVTEDVTWKLDPKTFGSVAENTSVIVQASIGEMMSNELEITGITVRNLYTYTITWLDKNETFKTTTVTEGDALVLPATNPTCETKEFVGWTALETIPEDATIEEMAFVNETTIPVADATYRAVFAKSQVVGAAEWQLVTTADDLKAGTKLLIASTSKNVVAGAIDTEKNIMGTVAATFENNVCTPTAAGAVELTLGGTSAAWTLTNAEGQLLGATAAKSVAWDKGTTTWTISIDGNKNATIQNTTATYGRFLHNVSSTRFTTYTSDASSSMLLPQLYKWGQSQSYSEFSFTCPSTPSDIESISVPATSVLKTIENGQLVILRDGVKYNAMGVRLQ